MIRHADSPPSPGTADPEGELLELTGLVYEAALDVTRWQDVADAFSRAIGGHAVTIMTPIPRTSERLQIYRSPRSHLPEELLQQIVARGMPWGPGMPDEPPESEVTMRFVRIERLVSRDELAQSEYYREWMRPHGMALAPPVLHIIEHQDRIPVAAVALFDRVGLPPIKPEQIAFADRLVPHLHRAHGILDTMRSMRREQDVFREVIDRIPSGIVLVDDAGRIVAMNTAARLAAESGDGLRVDGDRPIIDDPDENRWLQDALAKARDPAAKRKLDPEHSVTGRRSSHAGHTPVLVTPLLAPASDSSMPDTAALIFLGSPTLADVTSVRLLRSLYDLTRAEAELAMLLADGLSLEESAARRNVTLNTARSQLKRVFAKTGARRQSELVRIVLGGLVSTRTGDGGDPDTESSPTTRKW